MLQTGSFEDQVDFYRQRVNARLNNALPKKNTFPEPLHQAMRYSVMGGGKRVRPLLTYACGLALDVNPVRLDAVATAVELVHAFSLVHDDLPAMDDDDLRRGRATTHIKFDEATAILAGDALQALAYEVIATDPALKKVPAIQVTMISRLACAAGSIGMTGGQAQDLMAEGKALTLHEIELMHSRKTGLLIEAAIMMACDAAEQLSTRTLQCLNIYAKKIGLAFQVCDDILDVEGTTEQLGKPQGSDTQSDKATYPSVLGMARAKKHLEHLYMEAVLALQKTAIDYEPLHYMAGFIAKRDH